MVAELDKLCSNCINGHFAIWLVWDIDITTNEASLRAVTTTKECAEKYKQSIEKLHKEFDNHKFFVDIEPRDTNHAYGIKLIESIGAELKR